MEEQAIPFCLPLIDEAVVAEVNDCLLNTGWLTSGPKVRLLEAEIRSLTGRPALCVNSWTSGAMLLLRRWGVGPGDEVIVPAYTYCATALCAIHLGARVVMCDAGPDFNMDLRSLEARITARTKAIIPVDLGGYPCDYAQIMAAAGRAGAVFRPNNDLQQRLGRPLVIADAAHSLGATLGARPSGALADATVFSFHSVKNVTTGEGGAVTLNLPAPFDNEPELQYLRLLALNGQTKSAFEKNQTGNWRYDIVDQGMKVNMPDLCAAVGLAQMRRYADDLLPDRLAKFRRYSAFFSADARFCAPPFDDGNRRSSGHLYLLRIRDCTEPQRDALIERLSGRGIGVNVHYIPLPMLSFFKNQGYRMEDYPQAYDLYRNEITLPLYNSLSYAQQDRVISALDEFC
ncbi:MAG: DegT/DnrJ/EryC1/StrS family aminotransferase [Saprospiraceae bacterium]